MDLTRHTWQEVAQRCDLAGLVFLDPPGGYPAGNVPSPLNREVRHFRCACGAEFAPLLSNVLYGLTTRCRTCGLNRYSVARVGTSRYTWDDLVEACRKTSLTPTWEGEGKVLKYLSRSRAFRCACGVIARPRLEAVLHGHTTSCGCRRAPSASGHMRALNPELTEQRVRAGLAPGLVLLDDGTPADGQTVGERHLTVRCVCGAVFRPRWGDVSMGKARTCGCVRSRAQRDVADFVRSFGVEVEEDVRGLLGNGQEVDVYVPSHRLGIEYNGLRWHSERFRPPRYHVEKLVAAERAGIRLLTVFEDEWLKRPAAVRGYIGAVLGKRRRSVGARETVLDEAPSWGEVATFLDEQHVQGGGPPGRYRAVLRSDGAVVAALVCAYGRNRKRGRPRWELTRYCVREGWRVTAGFARLWKAFLRRYGAVRVVTFSDRRWSAGDLYRRAGFVREAVLPPSYGYVRGRARLHKATCQKTRLAERHGPLREGETEAAAAKRFGYDRIWDCGLVRWGWG